MDKLYSGQKWYFKKIFATQLSFDVLYCESWNNLKLKVATEFWEGYKYHGNPYTQGTAVPCDKQGTTIPCDTSVGLLIIELQCP